jgi:diamine N-acetyltransferase
MEAISFRRLQEDDVTVLQQIARQTFYNAFAGQNTPENMQHFLDTAFATEKLLKELRDPGSEFYFACINNEPVAYLKLNFGNAQVEFKEPGGMELERIYVLQSYQGKQIGQLLLNKALERAKEENKTYLWLGVWEKNPGAIRFYERNGFTAIGTHVFRLGDDDQVDVMMKRML